MGSGWKVIINVNVITETSYTIDIPGLPEEEEDELFQELSCEPCMDDIIDIESFLEEKDIYCETTEGRTDTRIEMWR